SWELVTGAVLGLTGLAALAGGLPRGLWLPPLALAGACGLFRVARSARPAAASAQLRRPAVQWGALLALAPALALAVAFRVAAPPDATSNCHGWVFTGGRYWVKGGAVEDILRDNGYRTVEDPRPGDLVVYRDDQGAVSHTGVVSSVGADGLVLVESKWSWLGR